MLVSVELSVDGDPEVLSRWDSIKDVAMQFVGVALKAPAPGDRESLAFGRMKLHVPALLPVSKVVEVLL